MTHTSFEQAFAPLRPHVGAASTLVLDARTAGLREGQHAITWFDWSALDPDARSMFAESQLFELATATGKGWDQALVPCGIVGGESHPVPLDELDQQTDGVLLLDLRNGGAVVFCAGASESEARPLAPSAAALVVR